jgi:hypothetical protein
MNLKVSDILEDGAVYAVIKKSAMTSKYFVTSDCCSADHYCLMIIQIRVAYIFWALSARPVTFLNIMHMQFYLDMRCPQITGDQSNLLKPLSRKQPFCFWDRCEGPLFFELECLYSPGTGL